jgi:hypothetical protein
MFQYVSDVDAAAEKQKHDQELQKAADRRRKSAVPAAAEKPAPAAQPGEGSGPKANAAPNAPGQ